MENSRRHEGEYLQQEHWRGFWWILIHNPKKILNKLLQYLAMHYLTPPMLRVRIQEWRGVRFMDRSTVFIADNVSFDERTPERISVGRGVMFAPGVRLLSHMYISHGYTRVMDIVIEDKVGVGANCVVLGGVTIGEGSLIGAGAVIAKDVEPYSLMACSPAKKVRDVRQDRDAIDFMKEADDVFDPDSCRYVKKDKS